MGNKNSNKKGKQEVKIETNTTSILYPIATPSDEQCVDIQTKTNSISNTIATQSSGNQNSASNYQGLVVIDRVTFTKIVYFWFHISLNSKSMYQINLDDIIGCCYDFYSFTGILLKYYYIHEQEDESSLRPIANNFDDDSIVHKGIPDDDSIIDIQQPKASQDSYLYIIHSNGNVYFIKYCDHLEDIITNNVDCKELNEYIDDTYLVKDKRLSSKQYEKLLSILSDLQINIKYSDSSSGGSVGWFKSSTWIITHCGKQIAESYSHRVKQYKEINEINCDELMIFMKEDMVIDVETISDVFKYPIQDTNGYGYRDRDYLGIDTPKNMLIIEDRIDYS